MKYILPSVILIIFSLSWCASNSQRDLTDFVVTISDRAWHILGKWVLLNSEKLMTATHIFRECENIQCRYISKSWTLLHPKDQIPDIQGDRTFLSIESLLPSWFAVEYSDPIVSMPIYTLVSRSGSWYRIDGKIKTIDQKYIAYDSILSGTVFTWGIETDIILEKGESGTPIWSLSWWLIWVMSAVDRAGRRSWIAR